MTLSEDAMRCPYCDSEYDRVHIEAVEVNPGGEITTVTKDGTRLKAGNPDGRGASVSITFWCESGHKWVRKFHFHKGATLITDEVRITGCPEYKNYVADLWRGQ